MSAHRSTEQRRTDAWSKQQQESIWALQPGSEIEAVRTLSGDNYPFPPVQLFTEGKRYKVERIHPMMVAAVVLDDTGNPNYILPDFLQNFKVIPLHGPA